MSSFSQPPPAQKGGVAMKPALHNQPRTFPGKWPSLPGCHLTFLSAGPWHSEAGNVWVSVTVLARAGELIPGQHSRATGREISLYIRAALLCQAHPYPDPCGVSRSRTFIPFLVAVVVGGHPDAKWHSLCLRALVQVLRPSVALQGPLALPMSLGGPAGRPRSDSEPPL